MGHIFVDRKNTESAKKSINAAKEKIRGGTSIMFFAEGTRSNDGKLMEFKKGAFRFAIDMKLPILPVTIVGTKNVLPNRTRALFPGRAKMIIHKPVPIEGYSENNMDDLIKVARAAIQKGLDDNPQYD
jgi:1-acyl-sn-glycerol-3-phosphate acyltransferase